MTKLIKVTSGEIDFYEGPPKPFHTLEQLFVIITEAYELNGLAKTMRINGTDDQGQTHRLVFDFSNYLAVSGAGEDASPPKKQKYLGELLLDAGVITPEQLQTAVGEQGRQGFREKLGEVIVRLGYCTTAQIIEALSRQVGIGIKKQE